MVLLSKGNEGIFKRKGKPDSMWNHTIDWKPDIYLEIGILVRKLDGWRKLDRNGSLGVSVLRQFVIRGCKRGKNKDSFLKKQYFFSSFLPRGARPWFLGSAAGGQRAGQNGSKRLPE